MTTRTGVLLVDVPCAVCGSSDGQPILKAGDNEHDLVGSFTVVQCANCGHTFTNPRPTIDSIPALYPDTYSAFATNTRHTRMARAKSRYAHFVQFGTQPVRRRGRMLEVGCGAGANLRRHRELGLEVIGIEPSVGAAATASADGLDVIVGTDERVAELEPGTFDVVHALMVVEHVPDPRRTLRRLFDATAPGGALAVSTPNFDCRSRRLFGSHWFPLQLPRHFHHFDADRLCSLLVDAGWVIDRVWYQPTLTDTGKSLRLASIDRGRPLPERAVKLGFNLIDIVAFPIILAMAKSRGATRMTIHAHKPASPT